MSYLALLKLRDRIYDYNTIEKAKKYLKPGQKAPDGVKTQRGPKGGIYYNSEDLHALRGTTPQKRLPAFRKQENGELHHRTKSGEHGPGTYKITEKDGEHQLSFHGPEGDPISLGKHADIRELKKLVDKFKGGEKKEEPQKGPEKKEAIKEDIPEEKPNTPKRELQYDPSKLVNQHIAMTTGSAMNKYIRDAAGVNIRDDKELDRIQYEWAKHSESKGHKYENAFQSWHDFVNHGGLYNALSDSDKKAMNSYVLNQSNEERGIIPKVPLSAIPMGEKNPLSSGDKRHDPDQKKIATGLGTTTKQKAKETVAEFGTDTRSLKKDQVDKKSRQDRLSQNRLDLSEPKKKLSNETVPGRSFSHLRTRYLNHESVKNLPEEHKQEITRALDDAEKLFSSSKNLDEFRHRIGLKKIRLQKKEGESSDPSYYLMTMNTLHKTPDDWYHPVSEPERKTGPVHKPKTKTSAHSLAELRIKQDMVNAGLDPESHDISSLMDRSLNYRENRANVAKQLGYSYTEKEKKEAAQRINHHQCITAQERCEVHGDKVACKEYQESGCNKVYGELET